MLGAEWSSITIGNYGSTTVNIPTDYDTDGSGTTDPADPDVPNVPPIEIPPIADPEIPEEF